MNLKNKITFPGPKNGRGMGVSTPAITLPWKSPGRVTITGKLSDIVASTLIGRCISSFCYKRYMVDKAGPGIPELLIRQSWDKKL
jgi:hypothetical protein